MSEQKLSLRRTEELLLSPGDYEVSAFTAQLRATTEVLREVLLYARHASDCLIHGWAPPQNPAHRKCSCGLDAALSKIEE
jgi:hypothetical protein